MTHPSGWIQNNSFTQWFKHFIDFANPTEEKPVLLLSDGHYSKVTRRPNFNGTVLLYSLLSWCPLLVILMLAVLHTFKAVNSETPDELAALSSCPVSQCTAVKFGWCHY